MKNDFDLLEHAKLCYSFYDMLKTKRESKWDDYQITDSYGAYNSLVHNRTQMCKYNTKEQKHVCVWQGRFKINYNYCTEIYRIMFGQEFITSCTFSTLMSEYFLNCPTIYLEQDLVVQDIETVLSTPSYAGFIFIYNRS